MKFGTIEITIKKGDITHEGTDVIVNAANSGLLGGGGVDGAIHRVGGPQILEECKQIREKQGRCPTGEAVITTGGNLPAKYVVHTVGPVWRGGDNNEPELLKNAYLNSLKLAADHSARKVAFPSISTGAYGYPVEEAAQVALDAVKEYADQHDTIEEVRFVLFSDRDLEIYTKTFLAMQG